MNNAARFGSFVLSCAVAGAVFAQAATPPVAPPSDVGVSSELGLIDANKDGKVSSTEAQSNAELRSAFSSLDADKDTYLTPSEFAKWNKAGKSGGAMPSSDRDASSNSASEPADSSASPQSSEQ